MSRVTFKLRPWPCHVTFSHESNHDGPKTSTSTINKLGTSRCTENIFVSRWRFSPVDLCSSLGVNNCGRTKLKNSPQIRHFALAISQETHRNFPTDGKTDTERAREEWIRRWWNVNHPPPPCEENILVHKDRRLRQRSETTAQIDQASSGYHDTHNLTNN